jgi:hypothetical protein
MGKPVKQNATSSKGDKGKAPKGRAREPEETDRNEGPVSPPVDDSLARACDIDGDAADEPDRVVRMRELGRRVAGLLRSDKRMFQVQAAIAVGMTQRNYYRYLEGDGPANEAFQAEVLPAVMWQASELEADAERDVGSCDMGSSAWASWHKWKLEKRFRKLFGDLAQKHEVALTGANGGPIKSESKVTATHVVSEDDAEAFRRNVLGIGAAKSESEGGE